MFGHKNGSRQRDISNFDIFVTPLVEQLDATNLGRDFFRQDGEVTGGAFDFDLTVVGHLVGSKVLCVVVDSFVLQSRNNLTILSLWASKC